MNQIRKELTGIEEALFAGDNSTDVLDIEAPHPKFLYIYGDTKPEWVQHCGELADTFHPIDKEHLVYGIRETIKACLPEDQPKAMGLSFSYIQDTCEVVLYHPTWMNLTWDMWRWMAEKNIRCGKNVFEMVMNMPEISSSLTSNMVTAYNDKRLDLFTEINKALEKAEDGTQFKLVKKSYGIALEDDAGNVTDIWSGI